MNDLTSRRGLPVSSAVKACGRDITSPLTMLMDGLFCSNGEESAERRLGGDWQ